MVYFHSSSLSKQRQAVKSSWPTFLNGNFGNVLGYNQSVNQSIHQLNNQSTRITIVTQSLFLVNGKQTNILALDLTCSIISHSTIGWLPPPALTSFLQQVHLRTLPSRFGSAHKAHLSIFFGMRSRQEK